MSTEDELAIREQALVLTALNPTKIPRLQKFTAGIRNPFKLV
jgi:hypothetical protein